jgi:putative transposase
LVVDGRGIPLGIVSAGANCPDAELLVDTLEAIVVPRPPTTPDAPQHLCLDAGYDQPFCREASRILGYTPHIRPGLTGAADTAPDPDARPRRWVVEVTHSWLNRFRKILVRFEELECTQLALLHFACAYIVFKRAKLF